MPTKAEIKAWMRGKVSEDQADKILQRYDDKKAQVVALEEDAVVATAPRNLNLLDEHRRLVALGQAVEDLAATTQAVRLGVDEKGKYCTVLEVKHQHGHLAKQHAGAVGGLLEKPVDATYVSAVSSTMPVKVDQPPAGKLRECETCLQRRRERCPDPDCPLPKRLGEPDPVKPLIVEKKRQSTVSEFLKEMGESRLAAKKH